MQCYARGDEGTDAAHFKEQDLSDYQDAGPRLVQGVDDLDARWRFLPVTCPSSALHLYPNGYTEPGTALPQGGRHPSVTMDFSSLVIMA
jgi:hypothetical protein